MELMTKEVEERFEISRQTKHNWINEGILPIPKKDFRNWYIWSDEDVSNLQKIIDMKTINNNKVVVDDTLLKIENRRYLGSKQKMLSFIEKVVSENTEGVEVVADIFGGTGVVADLFRR